MKHRFNKLLAVMLAASLCVTVEQRQGRQTMTASALRSRKW